MNLNQVRNFQSNFSIGESLSVDDFDNWCIKHDLVDDPGTEDKSTANWALLLKQRNNTRTALNKMATSSDIDADERFRVDLDSTANTYIVASVSDYYAGKQKSLPTKLQNYFGYQQLQLKAALESVDIATLTIEAQLQLAFIKEEADDFAEDIEFAIKKATKKYARRSATILKELEDRREQEEAKLLN